MILYYPIGKYQNGIKTETIKNYLLSEKKDQQ